MEFSAQLVVVVLAPRGGKRREDATVEEQLQL